MGVMRTVNHKVRVYNIGANGLGTSIAAGTTDYITLLQASDTPDSQIIANDSTIPLVRDGARITSIDINVVVKGTSGVAYEVFLFKDYDGELAAITPSGTIWTGEPTTLIESARKHIVGYRCFVIGSSSDLRPMRIPVSGAALRRNSVLREDDLFKMAIVNNSSGQVATVWYWGSINVQY